MRKGQEQFHQEVVHIELVPIEVGDPRVDLVSTVEAAEILGVLSSAVTHALDRGEYTVVRRSGSSRRWLLRSEVVARLDGRRGDG